jgi:predicted ATPase
MAKAACGELAESIALEGCMPSVLCALPRRDRKPVRMRMGVELDEFSYELVCGLPIPGATMFFLDPAVKEEFVWLGSQRKPTTTLLSRKNTMVTVRDGEGRSVEYPMELEHNESVLSQVKEPHRYPELSVLREEILGWRFYHQFRTDCESSMRVPRISVRTPVLSNDGSDLVAALQTIHEIGQGDRLADTVNHAFPGAELEIGCDTGQVGNLRWDSPQRGRIH